MKHISSRGPYLSSRKAANSASLLSPYKSRSSFHLWNDTLIFALVFSLALSNSFFLHCFSSSVFLILLFDMGSGRAFFRLCCCCLFSAIVNSLSLNVSDQVRAGTAPVLGRGAASSICMRIIDSPDWLCSPGRGGFLQIKLGTVDGATVSGFLHSRPESHSTVRS